jgi:hypothetical protein
MARMMMNFVLMHYNYPPVIIKMEDRQVYYALTDKHDEDSNRQFVECIADLMIHSLGLHLDSHIETDIDDVDKELALFIRDLHNKSFSNHKVTSTEINSTVLNIIVPMIETIISKTALIEEFFEYTDKKINMVCLKTNKKPNEVEIKDVYFTNYNTDKMIRPLLKPENKVMRMEFIIHFRKFKTVERKFDVRTTLFMKFDDHDYSLSNYNNELEMTKSYNDPLTDSESSVIIRTLIKDIKKYIQDKIG